MICTLKKAASKLSCFLGVPWIFRKLGGRSTIILVYHRVMDKRNEKDIKDGEDKGNSFLLDQSLISASPNNFDKQMQHLSRKYKVISLEEFIDSCNRNVKLPKNSVVITFDDGYKDNYSYAYPILNRYGLRATIFLAAGAIEKEEMFWWDKVAYLISKSAAKDIAIERIGRLSLKNMDERRKAIREVCLRLKDKNEKEKNSLIESLSKELGVKLPKKGLARQTLLTWKEIDEMSKGGISFGAHTLTHPILTNMPIAEARNEIVLSKDAIEKAIKKRVMSFSYPNGYRCDFNEEIKEEVKRAGFECAVTYMQGRNNRRSDLFELRRISVRYDDDMCSFRNKLAGLEIIPAKIYIALSRLAGKERI